jgi:acetolactate synthase-1/3 small subunit
MDKEFIITIFSENKVGLLSQITTVFTHRNVNIDSITASESAIEGIHKFTVIVRDDAERIENLVKQIEKKIDVLKVFLYTPDEVVLQELALYKVARSRTVEDMVRRHNIRILEIHDDYIVVEKTGHRDEIRELYRMLEPYGVYQYVCSGQIAIVKSQRELLNEYLSSVDARQQTDVPTDKR